MNENELTHYGVKGMKWGVRRYEKNAGSYTKRGIKRFNENLSAYEKAKAKQKQVKGSKNKMDKKMARGEVKVAKRQLKSSYKKLKTDKLADEGKMLYKQGYTIGENNLRSQRAQMAIVAGGALTNYVLNARGAKHATEISAAVTIGGSAVNAMLGVSAARKNKRLRAYYAH